MEALSGKTVILVTHQVDFLPAFDTVLVGTEPLVIQFVPFLCVLLSVFKQDSTL